MWPHVPRPQTSVHTTNSWQFLQVHWRMTDVQGFPGLPRGNLPRHVQMKKSRQGRVRLQDKPVFSRKAKHSQGVTAQSRLYVLQKPTRQERPKASIWRMEKKCLCPRLEGHTACRKDMQPLEEMFVANGLEKETRHTVVESQSQHPMTINGGQGRKHEERATWSGRGLGERPFLSFSFIP